MAKIRVMRDSKFAPCSYLVVRANASGIFDAFNEADSVLVSDDWSFPSLAREFGWEMRSETCAHSGTDGTIDCPDCGEKASDMIAAASCWLSEHAEPAAFSINADDSQAVEDPGYFTGESA